MALGLPVILFTAMVQRHSRLALAAARTTPGGTTTQHSTMARIAVKAQPHVSWRRTAWGGAVAVGGFIVLVGGYMAMRLLGIGPAGTLSAAGVFGSREGIVVADFASPASDTTLGLVVTEALRTDLAQSPNLAVLDPNRIRAALQRMQAAPDARLNLALARDVATREGAKAVVDGSILGIGGSYVVNATLVEASSGNVLVQFRETADDAKGLLPAIGRVSKALRAKVGESLKSVRATPPLEAVTTGSLPALRKYQEGVEAIAVGGDAVRADSLLRQAIALDTGFAMAWRKLGIIIGNSGGAYGDQVNALTHAFAHRDRLTLVERALTSAAYYNTVAGQTDEAISAYRDVLELDSTNFTALNNISLLLSAKRDFAGAARYLRLAVAGRSPAFNAITNLSDVEFRLGDRAKARALLDSAAAQFPNNPSVDGSRAMQAFARGEFDSTAIYVQRGNAKAKGDPSVEAAGLTFLGSIAETQGRLRTAGELGERWAGIQAARGRPEAPLIIALLQALDDVWFRDDRPAAMARVQRALALHPIDIIPVVQRPYRLLAEVYARAGESLKAKQTLAEMAARLPAMAARLPDNNPAPILGLIALNEGKSAEAVTQLTIADRIPSTCDICWTADLARAYDRAGNRDSAVAGYRRYVDTPDPLRFIGDGLFLASSAKRLGELYEAAGDTARAITAYARFTALWKTADPELQPQVAEVKRRLEGLARREAVPAR